MPPRSAPLRAEKKPSSPRWCGQRDIFRELDDLFFQAFQDLGLGDVNGLKGDAHLAGGRGRTLVVEPYARRTPCQVDGPNKGRTRSKAACRIWALNSAVHSASDSTAARRREHIGLVIAANPDTGHALSSRGSDLTLCRVTVPSQSRRRLRRDCIGTTAWIWPTWAITSWVTSAASASCSPRSRQ